MSNRMCVFVNKQFVPVNDTEYYLITKPKKIGDDAVIAEQSYPNKERKVKLLKSQGMVRNSKYLVDLERKEAWHYTETK